MIINKESIKKILLIKPRGIGDVILSTIVLKNIKSEIENCEIHFLTEKFAAPVLENNPYISKIFTFGQTLMDNFFLISQLRKENYDIIFDFYSNPRTAQFTFLIKSKLKIGYNKRGRNYAYNIKITINDPDLHSALAHLEFLKAIGVETKSKDLIYYIKNEEKEKAKFFLARNNLLENLIAIIPGGGWESKRCEPEKFAEISEEINKIWNSKFLILYGKDDYQDAIKIHSLTKEFSILAPETTIREMVALISFCKAVIANDSGPMHLSAAVGIPTIGIFGPTNPKAHSPFGKKCFWVRNENLDCIQCNLNKCPKNHECMLELDSQLIIEKLKLIFNSENE